jgi:hypothetical protein
MLETITYWLRIGCTWRRVTTSVAQWARLPHVSGGCKLVPALLTGLMLPPASPAVPTVPPAYNQFVPASEATTEQQTPFTTPLNGLMVGGLGGSAIDNGTSNAHHIAFAAPATAAVYLPDADVAPHVADGPLSYPISVTPCCDPVAPREPIPEPTAVTLYALGVLYCLQRRARSR